MAAGRFEVELTRGAENDLQAIHAYLAEHRSINDADALLEAFLEKIHSLERYPLRGSVPQELDSLGSRDFRQILMSPYRLIYRVVDRRVVIAVIADGRRDMQTLLQQRLLGA